MCKTCHGGSAGRGLDSGRCGVCHDGDSPQTTRMRKCRGNICHGVGAERPADCHQTGASEDNRTSKEDDR
jgi:hypothetical protein